MSTVFYFHSKTGPLHKMLENVNCEVECHVNCSLIHEGRAADNINIDKCLIFLRDIYFSIFISKRQNITMTNLNYKIATSEIIINLITTNIQKNKNC